MSRYIWLSYPLDEHTPSYGNREKLVFSKNSSMEQGDVSNHTVISMSLHLGTHLDMPFHFYQEGQTIVDFPPWYWWCEKVAFLSIQPKNLVVRDELLDQLPSLSQEVEILLVKTGACEFRHEEQYMLSGYGFHPDVARELRGRFPNLRIFGFDTISVSSFKNRALGREAHRSFLHPDNPIILLEDMDLSCLSPESHLEEVHVVPLRLENADGLPCSVVGLVR